MAGEDGVYDAGSGVEDQDGDEEECREETKSAVKGQGRGHRYKGVSQGE